MILFEKSVFPILNLDNDHDWNELLNIGGRYADKSGIERLKKCLEGDCKSIVIEREYIDKDYRNTFANFHAKRFVTPPSRCIRLHFFSKHITEEQFISFNILDNGTNKYLGYSVIRATRPNSIGRTFLSHQTRMDKDSHLCLCDEKVHIAGEQNTIKGFPFISQDADATVCAESALWMLLRYLSNRYALYSETLPFQITQLANHHAIGRRVFPSGGLSSWQLSEALRLSKLSPLIYSRPTDSSASDFAEKNEQFEHLLYTYIESGFPLLTTVKDHVFPTIGHTSDFSKIIADNSKPIYTSHFNKSFTICDDNHFPYQSLPKRIPTNIHDSKYKFEDINEFIVPLPEKVFLSAESAQAAINTILNDPSAGIKNNSALLDGASITLRLFLTTARAFKAKLKERGMGNDVVASTYRQIPLPHFVWICEISLTEDYVSDQSVLGEVIWDATRNAHEPDGWIAVHYPEQLSVDLGSTLNQSQQIVKIKLLDSTSYPLLRSNLNSY